MNTLGKISLILALFCFLLTLGFWLALQGWIPFIGWGIGFGVFFLCFALIINVKYLKNLLKSESLHFVAKSLTVLSLVFAILCLGNFLVYKKNQIKDLTANKIHSLSSLTQALVRAVPEPLVFHYFHVDNETTRGFANQVRLELQAYLNLNPQMSLRVHSVFKRPDLAKKFKTGNEESSLFAEYRGRIQRVSALTESAIANVLLKLTKKPKKIYFLQSHDSRKIQDESSFGLQGIKSQLERLHYNVGSLENLESLPEDLAILVFVGPRLRLESQDIKRLQVFLQKGGHLLIAADPGEDHAVNELLAPYGVQLQPLFMFSQQAQAGQSNLLVLTHRGRSEHEISRTLAEGENPAFFMAAPLSIDMNLNDAFKVFPVLEHLPNSVSRKDIEADSPGLKTEERWAAALVEGNAQNYFRLAVVGDSDFMTNRFYSLPGNFNFLLSLMAYLSRDEDLLKMQIPMAETQYLIMPQTTMNLYFLFFILPMAVIFFVIALFFKLKRLF